VGPAGPAGPAAPVGPVLPSKLPPSVKLSNNAKSSSLRVVLPNLKKPLLAIVKSTIGFLLDITNIYLYYIFLNTKKYKNIKLN
jgi:hypothetical protein